MNNSTSVFYTLLFGFVVYIGLMDPALATSDSTTDIEQTIC